MSVPANSIQFSYGANSVDLPLPNYGYSVLIAMALDIQKLDQSGNFSIYDNGSTYDVRSCEIEFDLTTAEQLALNQYIDLYTRGRTHTMAYGTGSGFYPFGPDKGNAGPFTVMLDILDQKGQGDAPYKYFKTKIKLTNAGAYPAFSLPVEVSDGKMSIGSVYNLRFPVKWFDPKINYSIDQHVYAGTSTKIVHKGSGNNSYNTACEITCNTSKAAALVAFLTGAGGRNNSFQLCGGGYPFGRDQTEAGPFTVLMIQDILEIQHNRHNEFSFNLNFQLVS